MGKAGPKHLAFFEGLNRFAIQQIGQVKNNPVGSLLFTYQGIQTKNFW